MTEEDALDREEIGRQAAAKGFATEHVVAGILMEKYRNVSLVDLPLSKFDLIIALKGENKTEDFIRAQVKTADRAIKFTGGGRAGIDRVYKSGIKEYVQSTATSDVIIGLKHLGENRFELYFVPTILVEQLNQKSISTRKIQALRNNYEILENCKNREFVLRKCREYGILRETH